MTIPIYYSEKLLEFKGKFPDTPQRLIAITKYLSESGLKYKYTKPRQATRKDLERVHSPKYLDEIKNYKRINTYFPDEPIDEKTYEIASLSAGAAIGAAEYAIRKNEFAFALTRPKGSHAGRDFFGGYSYINNIAVAVAKALDEGKTERPLIINTDAHFCNGTNNIFLNDKRVYMLSLHQYADSVYPYVGKETESSCRMQWHENRLWITDKEFTDKFREAVSRFVDKVEPDLIGVSAGFNTFYKDVFFGTVTKIKEPRTYQKIGRLLDALARGKGIPIFGVLEGGYCVEDLGELVYNFLRGFEGEKTKGLPDIYSEGRK